MNSCTIMLYRRAEVLERIADLIAHIKLVPGPCRELACAECPGYVPDEGCFYGLLLAYAEDMCKKITSSAVTSSTGRDDRRDPDRHLEPIIVAGEEGR